MNTVISYLFGGDNLYLQGGGNGGGNGGGVKKSQKEEIATKIKNITEEDAIRDYEKLKHADLNKITNETRTGNKFVDHFTFLERLETVSKKGMSYFEFIKDTEYHKKRYIQNLLNYQKGEDKHVALYRVFKLHCGSIGLFKPLTAMELYNKFKPNTVLDFTMGWGGRLVGACVLDIPKYIGIDSNKQLKEPYNKMVKLLKNQGTKTKIKLMFKDALKVDYSKLDYDCVLTSPPYYNLEVYTGTKSKTDEEWEYDFYIPLFSKTYKHLKKNGYYILNIPKDVYSNICVGLLGNADIKIPLKKKAHPKNKHTEKDYTEFIYVWRKR